MKQRYSAQKSSHMVKLMLFLDKCPQPPTASYNEDKLELKQAELLHVLFIANLLLMKILA